MIIKEIDSTKLVATTENLGLRLGFLLLESQMIDISIYEENYIRESIECINRQ